MDESVVPRKVSWGAVIGGIVIAWLSGIVIVPLSMIAGAGLADQIGGSTNAKQIIAVLVAVLISALIILVEWWLIKRSNRDLATGILVGGAIVVIISGGCGALLSGLSGGLH